MSEFQRRNQSETPQSPHARLFRTVRKIFYGAVAVGVGVGAAAAYQEVLSNLPPERVTGIPLESEWDGKNPEALVGKTIKVKPVGNELRVNLDEEGYVQKKVRSVKKNEDGSYCLTVAWDFYDQKGNIQPMLDLIIIPPNGLDPDENALMIVN